MRERTSSILPSHRARSPRRSSSRRTGSTLRSPARASRGRSGPRSTDGVRSARTHTMRPSRLDALAPGSAVEVTGVNTAHAGTGQYGIASESIIAIPAPTIAVIADDGVSQTAYGAIWYSLERRYGVHFTPIAMQELDRDLSRFTAILLPPGRYSRVSRDALERL